MSLITAPAYFHFPARQAGYEWAVTPTPIGGRWQADGPAGRRVRWLCALRSGVQKRRGGDLRRRCPHQGRASKRMSRESPMRAFFRSCKGESGIELEGDA